LLEFAVPKLSRSEIKAEVNPGEQQIHIKIDSSDINLSS
jgi:hypothetical protein